MSAQPSDRIDPDTPENTSFVRGLVERKEAAWPDRDGKLPPGVTHEILGMNPNGLPSVRERRKSLF
jgi:hypothetical protein